MLDCLLHNNINTAYKYKKKYFLDLLKLQWVSSILNNVMLGLLLFVYMAFPHT